LAVSLRNALISLVVESINADTLSQRIAESIGKASNLASASIRVQRVSGGTAAVAILVNVAIKRAQDTLIVENSEA
jgi:hypothetical protein